MYVVYFIWILLGLVDCLVSLLLWCLDCLVIGFVFSAVRFLGLIAVCWVCVVGWS